MACQKGRFQMSEQINDFAGYVAQMRERVERDFPGPEAEVALRLVAGWGKAMPKEAQDEPATVAADWRARALAEAQTARAHGGMAGCYDMQKLASTWLALHGRGASGRKFVEGGAQ